MADQGAAAPAAGAWPVYFTSAGVAVGLALESGGNLETLAGVAQLINAVTTSKRYFPVMGISTTGTPSYTTNRLNPLSIDTNGQLRVLLNSGAQVTILDDGGVQEFISTNPGYVRGTVTANGPADVTTTGNIANINDAVTVALSGYAGVSFQIAGTWVGILWPEVSVDGGATYATSPVPCLNFNTSSAASTFQINALGTPLLTAGVTHFRLRAQGWTSGTANITLTRTAISQNAVAASESTGNTPPYVQQVGGPLGSVPTIMVAPYVIGSAPGSSYFAWCVRQVPEISSRSDTYTAAANGTTVNISTHSRQYFAIQVKGTGAAATAWEVVLEGSLDGTNFTTILTHKNTTQADGEVLWLTVPAMCLYFRSRCVSITLGGATNVIATILGRY